MNSSTFPWRLFRRFFLLVFIQIALVVGGAVGLEVWLLKTVGAPLEWTVFSAYILAAAFLCALVVSWQVVRPFHRTLKKAVRIASKKRARALFGEEIFQEDLADEEPGEFTELELVLDQIEEKLKRRKVQLALERQESKALLSAIEHGIATVDLEQKVVHFNSEFATHFLSRDQVREHADKNALQLDYVFRDPGILELFHKCVQEKKMVRTQLRVQSYMQTALKNFLVSVTPLRDERSGQVYGALALFQDLTELKKSEQIRIEFVENASHELRTPLTSIKGFLATLKEDVEHKRWDQVPEFLGIVMRNVDRLTELVNDMLTLATLEHGSEFQFEEVNLSGITRDVLERLSPLAAEKHIVIQTQVLVETMKGDEKKLLQVVSNLISNAIKYIPQGGQIDVVWEPVAGGRGVQLRVKDNGPGISGEHLDRLFERFYRIDRGRSREVGGTGLGLAIVKHIVLNHGGTVRVNSVPGQGAEFICEFP